MNSLGFVLDNDAKERNPILHIYSRRKSPQGLPCLDIRTIGFHPEEAKILTTDLEKSRKMILRTIRYLHSPLSHQDGSLFNAYFPKDSHSYVIGVYESILQRIPLTLLKSHDGEKVVASALKHDRLNKVSVNGHGPYFKLSPRSRAGAICHEVSHIVGTEDKTIDVGGKEYAAYGALGCQLLRQMNEFDALSNADTYNCFAKAVDQAFEEGNLISNKDQVRKEPITATTDKDRIAQKQSSKPKKNTRPKYIVQQVFPQQKGSPHVMRSDDYFWLVE